MSNEEWAGNEMLEVVDCVVEAGFFIRFENPRNSDDVILVPTAKLDIEMGGSRRDARREEEARIRNTLLLGYRKVMT